MNKPTSIAQILTDSSCINDYDPNSMPVNQAREFIKAYLTPVSAVEKLPLHDCLGRILAEEIISPFNVPSFDNSAMDGYAFLATDSTEKITLKIVGTSFAGGKYEGIVSAGQCVRIMTGGVMPLGCDTVVIQEKVLVEEGYIHFINVPKRGANVRYAGDDLKTGQVVFNAGLKITPAELGLIASLGMAEVLVYRRLKVAFFSTGDELIGVGKPLENGQIYDSNRYTLHGMLTAMNVEIMDMGVIRDDPIALENALIEASQKADVIITSGGVSVGEADYMKLLLEKLGQVLFWKIAMKPGRPLAFGKIGQAHYFGLPGNPVAVMVTFYQFVREAILILMGQPTPKPLPLFKVTCTEPIKKMTGRTEFQRGILYLAEDGEYRGEWVVKPLANQSSGVLSSMSMANCFIVLATEVGNVAANTQVQVQVFDGVV